MVVTGGGSWEHMSCAFSYRATHPLSHMRSTVDPAWTGGVEPEGR